MTGSELHLPGVTIRGAGFAPGLTLVAMFPDGGEMKLGGTQITAASPDSFTAVLALEARGLWTFRVVGADGKMSDAFVVRVE